MAERNAACSEVLSLPDNVILVDFTQMRKIDKIIVHHSASPRDTTIETIRKWHKSKGWKDIGYHFVIDDVGAIHVGRSLGQIGAHCVGANRNSIGICVTGNNLLMDHKWNDDQRESLIDLIQDLIMEYGQEGEITILGHRDYPGASTACPGLDIAELLSDYDE